MSDEVSDAADSREERRRLTLVISQSAEDGGGSEQTSGPGEKAREREVALALKALYRQSNLLEVRIDDDRKRRAISEALSLWGSPPKKRRTRHRLLAGTALLILAAASLVPLYMASRDSLPGEPLWRIKRAGESVKQWMARGSEAEARVALANTSERLEEAQRLADEHRFETARGALTVFYSEFDGARRRLRVLPKETHPDLYQEADRQLEKAASLDERLNGEAARTTAPRAPEAVGTLSPTPRPPWQPENPQETP